MAIKPWYEKPVTKAEVERAGLALVGESVQASLDTGGNGQPKLTVRQINQRVLEQRCVQELKAWVAALPGDLDAKRAYVERCKAMGVDFKSGTVTVACGERAQFAQLELC